MYLDAILMSDDADGYKKVHTRTTVRRRNTAMKAMRPRSNHCSQFSRVRPRSMTVLRRSGCLETCSQTWARAVGSTAAEDAKTAKMVQKAKSPMT